MEGMTVVVIPTWAFWTLLGLLTANTLVNLRKAWLQRKLDKASAPKLRDMTEADFAQAQVVDWKPKDPGCWCARCDMEHNVTRTRMSVCNQCGDKRCPRAEDHRNECSKAPNAANERGPL
jgi:hypothetical protein